MEFEFTTNSNYLAMHRTAKGMRLILEDPQVEDITGVLADKKASYLLDMIAEAMPEDLDDRFIKNQDLDCLIERIVQIKGLDNFLESASYYAKSPAAAGSKS